MNVLVAIAALAGVLAVATGASLALLLTHVHRAGRELPYDAATGSHPLRESR